MNYLKRMGANFFIFFLLMTMIKTHLPMDTKIFQSIYRPITWIENSFGTDQSWLMFSPNPAKMDAFVTGEVEYIDGSKETYDFNKGIDLNTFEKYLFAEKYRKYTSEHLRLDENDFLWSDGARFAMNKLKEKNNFKIPVKVSLKRHWSEIPDWNKKFIKHSQWRNNYNSYVFYTKEVL